MSVDIGTVGNQVTQFAFYCCDKHHEQSNQGKKEFFCLTIYNIYIYIYIYIYKVHFERKSQQKLKQSPWKTVASWLAPKACSNCFLIQLEATYSGVALLLEGWVLPHQLQIKKTPHRVVYRLRESMASRLMTSVRQDGNPVQLQVLCPAALF